MTFVRKKNVPPGSDNEYYYEVRSVRKEDGVMQKHERYLGKYPHGASVGATRRGASNQQIEKVAQVGETGFWADPRLDESKIQLLINDYEMMATEGQMNNVKRIELYAKGSYKSKAGEHDIIVAGTYNHNDGERIHVYDCAEKSAASIETTIDHELAHNTWHRLEEIAKKEENEYTERKRQYKKKHREKFQAKQDEIREYLDNTLQPKRDKYKKKLRDGEITKDEYHEELEEYEQKYKKMFEKREGLKSKAYWPVDEGHFPSVEEECPTYAVYDGFVQASEDEPAVSSYSNKYKKDAKYSDGSYDFRVYLYANENFAEARKEIMNSLGDASTLTSHGGSTTTVSRTRRYYKKIIEMDENEELEPEED